MIARWIPWQPAFAGKPDLATSVQEAQSSSDSDLFTLLPGRAHREAANGNEIELPAHADTDVIAPHHHAPAAVPPAAPTNAEQIAPEPQPAPVLPPAPHAPRALLAARNPDPATPADRPPPVPRADRKPDETSSRRRTLLLVALAAVIAVPVAYQALQSGDPATIPDARPGQTEPHAPTVVEAPAEPAAAPPADEAPDPATDPAPATLSKASKRAKRTRSRSPRSWDDYFTIHDPRSGIRTGRSPPAAK